MAELSEQDKKNIAEVQAVVREANYPDKKLWDFDKAAREENAVPEDERLFRRIQELAAKGYKTVPGRKPGETDDTAFNNFLAAEKSIIVIPSKQEGGLPLLVISSAAEQAISCGLAGACVIKRGIAIPTLNAHKELGEFIKKNGGPTNSIQQSGGLSFEGLMGVTAEQGASAEFRELFTKGAAVHELKHGANPIRFPELLNIFIASEYSAYRAQTNFVAEKLGVATPSQDKVLDFVVALHDMREVGKSLMECFEGKIPAEWQLGRKKLEALIEKKKKELQSMDGAYGVPEEDQQIARRQYNELKTQPFLDTEIGKDFRSGMGEIARRQFYLNLPAEVKEITTALARQAQLYVANEVDTALGIKSQ